MSSLKTKVVLADDHPFIVDGLQAILQSKPGFELVGVCHTPQQIFHTLRQQVCDVLVSDFSMPNDEASDGVAMFSKIIRAHPQLKIIVITMVDNTPTLRALLALGIKCILSKADSSRHVLTALQHAKFDQAYYSPAIAHILERMRAEAPRKLDSLSTREIEVVRLFVSGLTITQIAEKLKRSKQTISTQKNSAMKKIGVERDADLIVFFENHLNEQKLDQ
ncbi:response regulator transcription factor [Chromobacterium amazonense]|uniref:Response regulator transcription factor n=1 Tax=Chromobacterium amazonense TaxID=1382803 RepID=A0ABU8UY62_9NEIS|nr:response regulator transcription factor [Chromobacterium amazonense]MDQ4540977.1 response regulator transcription factor [Chromobacterium amazonense]